MTGCSSDWKPQKRQGVPLHFSTIKIYPSGCIEIKDKLDNLVFLLFKDSIDIRRSMLTGCEFKPNSIGGEDRIEHFYTESASICFVSQKGRVITVPKRIMQLAWRMLVEPKFASNNKAKVIKWMK